MRLSPQQEAGVKLGRQWLRAALAGATSQLVFRVLGFAGTGKSTLIKYLTEDVNQDRYNILYCAPTGKAAKVMRSKGCPGAITIHRALYRVNEKGTYHLDELLHKRDLALRADDLQAVADLDEKIKREEERLRKLSFSVSDRAPALEADLIVIDEASMVGSKIGNDLLSLGIPILIQGDPGQLPPIEDHAIFMDDNPDVMLTEVHRQALDSGILQLLTEVRSGGTYGLGKYGDDCLIVKHKTEGNTERVLRADQVLVGRNDTRRNSNYTIRQARGREGTYPVLGDKLICRNNNYDLDLINGSQWTCLVPGEKRGHILADVTMMSLDGDPNLTTDMHACIFEGEWPSIKKRRDAELFEFGDAITVHLSQGSQWDDVCVLNESHRMHQGRDWRWEYTAFSRAAKNLTVVMM